MSRHPQRRRPSLRSPRALWDGTIAAVALVFGLLTVESMWGLWWGGTPSIETHLLGWLVSDKFARGTGSVFAEQHRAYQDQRVWLTAHTVMAGFASALSPLQFSARLRRRRPDLHQLVGRTWAGSVVLGTFASVGFLVVRAPLSSYSGPAFGVALWALALLTFASLAAGIVSIRRGAVRAHRYWMTTCFGALMVAPLLRVGWVELGRLADLPMDRANVAWHAVLFPSIALAVTSFHLRVRGGLTQRRYSLSGTRHPAWLVVAVTTLTATLIAVVPAEARPASALPGGLLAALLAVSTAAGTLAACGHRTAEVVALVGVVLLSAALATRTTITVATLDGPALVACWAVAIGGVRRARRRADSYGERVWRRHARAMAAAIALLPLAWLAALGLTALPEVGDTDTFEIAALAAPSLAAVAVVVMTGGELLPSRGCGREPAAAAAGAAMH